MRKPLMAGNWKMNKLNSELESFFASLNSETNNALSKTKVEVLFAAPFPLLASAKKHASPHGVRIAAQNMHWESSGAFTGEVSAPMLKELGVDSCLVGHSERRQYFGETDETVAKKTVAALKHQLTPVVCIGETLEERDRNETFAVIERQLIAVFSAVETPGDLVFAYEPVWAIGTGRSATSGQAQEVHAFIRGLVRKRYGESTAQSMRLLYGGSANPGNIVELMAQSDIDGALVGGASLKPSDFAKMIVACF